MARLSLEERLNRIEDKISEKSFRENKGLGNEVGYYVFDYDPRAELEVRNHIAYLKDRINNGNKDFKIIEFDLFHTMIQVLEEERYLEAFFDLEKENGFFDMADSLVETLGLDETNELNLIITKILQEDFAIEMTKTLESEVSTMCNLSKGVEEKGIEKGILFSIKSLMETMGWSAEQAMGGLKIPESERDKYITELKNEKL